MKTLGFDFSLAAQPVGEVWIFLPLSGLLSLCQATL